MSCIVQPPVLYHSLFGSYFLFSHLSNLSVSFCLINILRRFHWPFRSLSLHANPDGSDSRPIFTAFCIPAVLPEHVWNGAINNFMVTRYRTIPRPRRRRPRPLSSSQSRRGRRRTLARTTATATPRIDAPRGVWLASGCDRLATASQLLRHRQANLVNLHRPGDPRILAGRVC